jgi:type II secretory pathway component PulF
VIVTPAQLSRRAQLYHQLGSTIGAGVPLLKALEMASRHPEVRGSRKTVDQLIQSIQSGLTFTESMSRAQGWMPEFDVALLSVGEQTGRLDQSFRLLSTYYASRAQIIRDTISGLVTTIATLHVFLLVFPLRYLIALVQGIFDNNYALCVPFLVQKAAVFGGLYLVVFFLIFACQGQRGEGWRALVETMLSFVPVLRKARRYLALSRLAASLEASISSGVSVVTAWELASAAGGSSRLQGIIESWKPYIKNGSTPGELINENSYFPEMFANFYLTGEQSGRLDDSLARLQAYYQDEGFRKLRLFTQLMNGSIYGLVVLLVAYNVIQFYMGYFSGLNNTINGL